jgi:hypothetical protein
MMDFDSPMDSGPQEPQAVLPWESIDPDEPALAAVNSDAIVPLAPAGEDHDWAATAFLADELDPPAPVVFRPKKTLPEVLAPEPVVEPSAEENTPWNEIEPVMAEITAPQIDEPDVISTFARNDSIIAAASELAVLAESLQESSSQAAEAEAPPTFVPQAEVETAEPEIAATAAWFDIEPVAPTEESNEVELEVEQTSVTTNGGWTIPLMCLGIGLIACCVIIPQGDFNRRLHYEQASLETNLKSIEKQASVNEEFLKKIADDPELAERLSGRQLKTIRKGHKIIPLNAVPGEQNADISPFGLVAVAPPPPAEPYRPIRGTLADLCNNARARLYVLGSATMMVAVGLVMGFGTISKSNSAAR